MYELIQGHNVDVLAKIPDGPRFTLAYLDPPFATGRTQEGEAGSYTDNDPDQVGKIVLVANLCYCLLTEHGSIVVHLDWRLAPAVRERLDRSFGVDRFASEIIWSYKRWPTKTQNFQRTHDTLLRYVREPGKQRWNQLYQPLAESTLKTFGSGKQLAKFEDGQRKVSIATDEPSKGAPLGDVWEIPIVAPSSKERTGYPTQKPERLLERLILATTNHGDSVIDPYSGSGTTVAVAHRLGRNGVGIDRNPQAIEVARKRLEGLVEVA